MVLKDAQEELERYKQSLDRLLTPPEPPIEIYPFLEEEQAKLYPEERELLQARQELVLMDEKYKTLEAEAQIPAGNAEEVQLAKALYTLLKAKAFVTDEELKAAGALALADRLNASRDMPPPVPPYPSGYGTPTIGAAGDPMSPAAGDLLSPSGEGPLSLYGDPLSPFGGGQEAFGAAMGADEEVSHLQDPESVRVARDAVIAAEKRIDDKVERKKAVDDGLGHLYAAIPEMQQYIQQLERGVENLRRKLKEQVEEPEAVAFASIENRTKRINDRLRLLRRMRHKYYEFSPDMFTYLAGEGDPQHAWLGFLERNVDDSLIALREILESYTEIRLSSSKAQHLLWGFRLTETLQQLPVALLIQRASEGPAGELQQQHINNRWQEIEGELYALEIQKEAYEQSADELRQGLNVLSASRYWCVELPQTLVAAHSYLVKLEETVKYLEKKQMWLLSISRESIAETVNQSFLNAITEAKRRKEEYGDDEEILKSVHEAHMEALQDTENQIYKTLERAERREADFCPHFDVATLPAIRPKAPAEPPRMSQEEREEEVLRETPHAVNIEALENLTGLTLPNVLQLRKKKAPKRAENP
ncbi:uncharacterized protein EMH_0051770 [Eimeria mitis]|uniref:Uncharacterized protein n=1 Tax=Eimeria mitis TaxID=44415 RepID=U6JY42_9EIME|nr:uncharacterized protein EMH_0051770 [Eimeria mitis]CDJ29686.1 hypothetical protein EMH_0051770 [Eimeria mitis]